jgi:general stress protein 26
MSEPIPEAEFAGKLVAGVERIIAAVPYCWLLVRTEEGILSRPMGRILARPGEDAWTIRFLTDLRSQKVADIRRSHRATLIFQKEDDEAYASLEGIVRLIETKERVQALWTEKAYSRHFPTDDDRANAGFIEVEVTRMELWVRGLTPEPFGVRTTTVTRDSGGRWLCAG